MFEINIPMCMPCKAENDTLCFITPNGEIIEHDLALEIIEKLNLFYSNTPEETISEYNSQIMEQLQNYITHVSKKGEKRKRKKGYVYIFESGNKYKIGFSKNVEQRLRQLDTRPFKLNKVYSKYFENAFDIEQFLHNSDLSDRRIEGEWYELSKSDLNQLINWLENMTDEIFETL